MSGVGLTLRNNLARIERSNAAIRQTASKNAVDSLRFNLPLLDFIRSWRYVF